MAKSVEKLREIENALPRVVDKAARAAVGVALAMIFITDQAISTTGWGSPLRGAWILIGMAGGAWAQGVAALVAGCLVLYASGIGLLGAPRPGRAAMLRTGVAIGAMEVFARLSMGGSLVWALPFFPQNFPNGPTGMASALSFALVVAGCGCCASLAMDAIFGQVEPKRPVAPISPPGAPRPPSSAVGTVGPNSSALASPRRVSGAAPMVSTIGGSGAKHYAWSALIPFFPALLGSFASQPGSRSRAHALAALDMGVATITGIAVAWWVGGEFGLPWWIFLAAWGVGALMFIYEAQRAAGGWAPSKSGRIHTMSIFFDD